MNIQTLALLVIGFLIMDLIAIMYCARALLP